MSVPDKVDVGSLTPDYSDDRGTITDLINGVDIRHAAVITSVGDTTRGNHFHHVAGQYTFVISGEIEVLWQEPGEAVETAKLKSGGYAYFPPKCAHAIHFLTDSELLTLTTQERDDGGYEQDTVRLDIPLSSNSCK